MGGFADLITSVATGSWRLERERVRELMELNRRHRANRSADSFYAGAKIGPDRPTPNILSTPEDFQQAYQRIILIRAARQMEEDMPFFDGLLGDFETYVVGDLRYMAATGNPDADKVINDYLEWQFDKADFTERLDLCGIARLAVRSYKRDGDCGFVFVDDGEGIRINYVSGDRIGNPMIGTSIGPADYNGIVTDAQNGRVIAYNIYKRIPKMNAYVFQQTIRANDFRHYYDPFRFEQYHGVTVFKNAVEHGFDMKQIMDFTKLNIKWRSSQLPYVQNKEGKPRGTGYETLPPASDGTPRPFDVQVGGVTQSFFKLDEGVMEYPNDFPNQQFKGIMEELKRDCAVGAKIPLEFCYRSDTGGVIQRFYVNKAENTFNYEKRLQRRVLLNPYKNRSIQKGIDTGFLDLSSFGDLQTNLARFRGSWQQGKAISVDYKNETTSDIAQIDNGLMAAEDFTSENGRDLAHIRQQNAQNVEAVLTQAKVIADKLKLDVAFVVPYLLKKFPNPGGGLTAEKANVNKSADEPVLTE